MKKNAEFEVEKEGEIARMVKTILADRKVDLEAWESYIRRVFLTLGARALEKALEGLGSGRRSEAVFCHCGERMKSVGLREKRLRTILGSVRIRRSLYLCPRCGWGCFPADRLLGVEGTSFSPGLQRMMARAGSRESFAEAAEDLRVYAELEVSAREVLRVAERIGKDIEAWTVSEKREILRAAGRGVSQKTIPVLYICLDGTGIPMRREELRGRKGRAAEGEARTREVKLGCVFTQSRRSSEGFPMRDADSTTYVGAIESSESFGWRLYVEALRRGLERAERVVFLSDGARYNKAIKAMHFPHALHILDFYHASEHLHEFYALLGMEEGEAAVRARWLELLSEGQIYKLIEEIRSRIGRKGRGRKELERKLRYFLENAEQMQYGEYRRQGLLIGSGVVEAGCRSLIGQRLKRSGMFWSEGGANAIIASRCCQFSRRFEDFWASQVL